MKAFLQFQNILRLSIHCLIILLLLTPPFFAEAYGKTAKLRHFVALKFKAGTTDKQIHEVEEAFRNLKQKIPQVDTIEGGTNLSPEKLNAGFTHGFIVSFKSEKDRNSYLVDPAHVKFKELVLPLVDSVFVFDFQESLNL